MKEIKNLNDLKEILNASSIFFDEETNELVLYCKSEEIKYENGDYDRPTYTGMEEELEFERISLR